MATYSTLPRLMPTAESQAYLDANKRTGAQHLYSSKDAACARLPDQETYEATMKIATHEMSRSDLAHYFRLALAQVE